MKSKLIAALETKLIWSFLAAAHLLEEIAKLREEKQAPTRATDADEFLAKMKEIYKPRPTRRGTMSIDIEETHHDSDALMERKLIDLGYEDAIAFLRTQKRWYS